MPPRLMYETQAIMQYDTVLIFSGISSIGSDSAKNN